MAGSARVRAASSDDFPALGGPMSATCPAPSRGTWSKVVRRGPPCPHAGA